MLRGSRGWFFGAFDPKAGAVSSLFDVMRDPRLPHRPKVVAGVMAEESSALLREFFDGRRACTVDG
ncbi:tRNA-specific adenosine-34 deaminase [Cutibacterium acnes JCM 18909]|nr:tRNA-specific adenosine-34 deaminase [Cutibacterium acnes JCM 18909]